MIDEARTTSRQSIILACALSLFVFAAYYFSNPQPGAFYDYTLRIAGAMLDGKLGLETQPPDWLNEMIPHNGKYYSAFPLGSVLTMMPLAVLQKLHLLTQFPGTFLAALLAALTTLFGFLLASNYSDNLWRRSLLALFPALATWMWPNLAFAGAWHIALGVAVAAQLAALYFTLVKPSPFWAGFFFALAFGNRTEILLLAPVIFYLLYKTCQTRQETPLNLLGVADRFVAAPIALGVTTLIYNYARFNSPFDFGYARIPGVLEEPWYQHGIFSIYAIKGNIQAMLLETWNRVPEFPYLVPTGFGGSILLSCPFLLLLFRRGTTDAKLTRLAWGAIAALTLVLWLHGNPGGWQISYRYAMVLLPWMLVILLQNSPKKVTPLEIVLFLLSVAINAFSTWLFLRTNYINSSYQ
jgi:hypothetical protein